MGRVGTWDNITPAPLWVNLNPPTPPPSGGSGNYGMMAFALAPSNPAILYAGTAYSGIWKSTDSGITWMKINTGTNSEFIDQGASASMAVDPTDPNVVYTAALFSPGQGVWKSTDGGVNWTQMLTGTTLSATTGDVYCIQIDPLDHLHVLVVFHSGWASGPDAGVIESFDGGANWTLHNPISGWGAGHNIFFLGKDDDGAPSSAYWILATQDVGYWRTTDSGATWTQVYSAGNMQHGASNMYRASTSVLYIGSVNHILRSTDNGQTWAIAGAHPSNQDGFNSIIGDGVRLFAQTTNTGSNTTGHSGDGGVYWTSLETDGINWEQYNDQVFIDGPYAMAFDSTRKLVYSSNWDAGLFRLASMAVDEPANLFFALGTTS